MVAHAYNTMQLCMMVAIDSSLVEYNKSGRGSSNTINQSKEEAHVMSALRDNGYPKRFI